MKNSLFFDFTVDKETKTVYVKREFAGPLQLVWDCWTKPELTDQWWAPKPYRAVTKSIDFREGGRWLYAMISPENEYHWCKADFKKIELLKSYSALDAFCSEDGTTNESFPRSFWTNSFFEDQDKTMVHVEIKYDSLEDLEKIISMGFKEGFTMGLGNLDELLETLVVK